MSVNFKGKKILFSFQYQGVDSWKVTKSSPHISDDYSLYEEYCLTLIISMILLSYHPDKIPFLLWVKSLLIWDVYFQKIFIHSSPVNHFDFLRNLVDLTSVCWISKEKRKDNFLSVII